MSRMTIEERLQHMADGRGHFDLAPLICEHALWCINDLKMIVKSAMEMRKTIKQKRRSSSVKNFDEALENLGGFAKDALTAPASATERSTDAAVKALVEERDEIISFLKRVSYSLTLPKSEYEKALRKQVDEFLKKMEATLAANGVK